MKRVYVSLCCSLFCMFGQVWAEDKVSELEKLWDRLVVSNYEVLDASLEENIASRQFDYWWQVYIPKVNLSSTLTFLDFSKESITSPEFISSAVDITETLPFGLSLGISPVVTFKRETGVMESESVKYVDVDNVSLYVSQKLYSFWKEDEKSIPQKQSLFVEKQISSLQKQQKLEMEVRSITENYIYLRQTKRSLVLVKKKIQLVEKIMAALRQQQTQGVISFHDIYNQEEELLECENQLRELELMERNYTNLISEALGFSIPMEEDYFETCAKEILPHIKKMFSEKVEIQILRLYLRSLELQRNIERQNYSPIFELSGKLPVHNGYDKKNPYGEMMDRENKQWYVTASLNLGPMFSSNNKQLEDDYKDRKQIYENRIERAEERLESEKRKNEILLKQAESQSEMLAVTVENAANLYNAAQSLYKSGDISLIDLLQTENSLEIKQCAFENLKDLIWLYTWLLANT